MVNQVAKKMKYNYMASQLAVVLDDKCSPKHSTVSLKFNSNFGVTNWLSIKAETFKKIEAILMQEES